MYHPFFLRPGVFCGSGDDFPIGSGLSCPFGFGGNAVALDGEIAGNQPCGIYHYNKPGLANNIGRHKSWCCTNDKIQISASKSGLENYRKIT